MKKPLVALRAPPNADGFVFGADAQTPKPPDVQTPERPRAQAKAVVTRADGRRRRRMTVYLQPELARELEERCFEEQRELSLAVEDAVRHMLGAAPVATSAAESS